jgi:hypothetical protein
MVVQQSVDFLGKQVKDKISGRKGIVTSVCFDLYGCIQVVINEQRKDKDDKDITFGWIDINRLKIIKDKKIMDCPDFNNKYSSINNVPGPAEKRLPNS